jgi:hypothetical protein
LLAELSTEDTLAGVYDERGKINVTGDKGTETYDCVLDSGMHFVSPLTPTAWNEVTDSSTSHGDIKPVGWFRVARDYTNNGFLVSSIVTQQSGKYNLCWKPHDSFATLSYLVAVDLGLLPHSGIQYANLEARLKKLEAVVEKQGEKIEEQAKKIEELQASHPRQHNLLSSFESPM